MLEESKREVVESEMFPRHLAVQVSRCIALLLSLLSEIELFFSFGLAPRAVELWEKLLVVPEAKEIYENRYAKYWPILSGPIS